jgi:hypothetical protein
VTKFRQDLSMTISSFAHLNLTEGGFQDFASGVARKGREHGDVAGDFVVGEDTSEK